MCDGSGNNGSQQFSFIYLSITSDMEMTPSLCRKQRRTKEPLEIQEESEKVGLKLNTQKTKIMHGI